MKKTKYFLAVLFNLSCFFLFSQTEYIVEIDGATGGFTKIGSGISGITYVYPNIRAYDETNRRYIFEGGLVTPDHLFSIDVTNDLTISNPPYTQFDGLQFEFDNSTGKLFGLFFDNTRTLYFLDTINPATGAHANLSTDSIPNIGICQGFTTFDEIHHQYIMSDALSVLSVNAVTGLISSYATLGLLPGEILLCPGLSYDNSAGFLYGLLWDSQGTNKYFLVSIDPATGSITKIGSGTTSLNQGGSSAIDKAHQQYMYLYSNPAAGGYEIATMDIATGNLVYNAVVQLFNANDNFSGLEYDNVLGKLYSIHWETNTPHCNLSSLNITAGAAPFCSGDSGHLCAPAGYVSYLWNTGDTTRCISPRASGNYYVSVVDGNGCPATSNHLAISVYPLPSVSVSVNGDTLTAYGATGYQWYLNGSEITGATSGTYIAVGAGNYAVAVTDTNGCSAFSNAIVLGIEEVADNLKIRLYPNPAFSELNIYLDGLQAKRVLLFNTGGQLLRDIKQPVNNRIDISSFPGGIYIAEIEMEGTVIRKRWVKM